MYEIFLLYTMLFFSSLITIIIVGTFLVDAFVYLFGEKINFKTVSYNISPVGREFCLGHWHSINIVYEYEVSEKNYSSSLLNSTNSVMKLSYESANARLSKCLNESKVYVVKSFPKKIAMPDVTEPTSYGLTKNFYIRANKIADEVLLMLKIKKNKNLNLKEPIPHDVPGDWFKGPF